MQSKTELLVFPTSRSIREYINSKKEFNTLLPSIITVDELFKRTLLFKNKILIDEEQRFLYLKEAVKNTNLKALGISSNFTQFLKQSDYIYRFFLELSSEYVDIEKISCEDTYGFYSEHLQILKEIRNNYLTILDKNLAIDRINMQRYYQINKEFLNRYTKINLNFEGYFTSFEFEIIKEISSFLDIEINFIFNEFNKKSIEKFIEYGFELKLGYTYKINFSKKYIIEENPIKSRCDYYEIKGFSNRINQLAFIKKSLQGLVENGIDPSKVAIVLPDESFTTTLSLFDKERYFNYAMGLNIYNSSLYKNLDAIYLYINENEIKNLKYLEFIDTNIEEIDSIFKANWNKAFTKKLFENITSFFLEKEDNIELKEKFNELVYRFEKLIFSSNEQISLKDAYKILLNKITKISLDDVNSGKITVMGLLESRLIEFDAVIICDFNESLIPKRNVKDKFLSTKLKQKVNLPSSIDRENLQKYYYERLVKNSTNVFISYVKNDSEQLSRFATTLFDKKIDEKLYDNSYKHILYSSKEINHFDEDINLDIDLSKIIWSASSLKEFLECKRKYYFNHVIKIKEHDISLRPKAYELGNIVHDSLEEYYKEGERNYKRLVDIFNKNRSKNSFLNLDLEIWKRKLKDFVAFEEKRFELGFKVIELEKPFLCEFEGIKIQGKIDRVDMLNDEYYVIDYKTSSNLKISTKRTYENATDFQLEFYYLAIEDLFNTHNVKTFYYDLYQMQLKEEIVLEEKLELLKKIFTELKTKNVSFDKCENQQICQFCTYRVICKKE